MSNAILLVLLIDGFIAFNAPTGFLASAALNRMYNGLIWKVGSVWLAASAIALMSSGNLAKGGSAGFQPRALKLSR